MPSSLPLGDPAPSDGALPISVTPGADQRDLGIYVHVPFCKARCGYCDFNTYTSEEHRGARRGDYAAQAAHELRLAKDAMIAAGLPTRSVETVFFGGGTPTLLPVEDLAMLLAQIDSQWGLVGGAEVTTEANPDSVDRAYLIALARAGFTRVSFGMQSAVPHVLATLERTHDPQRIPMVVAWAREAGLGVSLDLIYGTPGESLDDWDESLRFAIAQAPDHLSAYALIVEEGTKLASQIRRGVVESPSDDMQADMYEHADQQLSNAGYEWYEVSNWAMTPGFRSRHNLAYWTGQDWWGIGPGAHSHIGGTRWWNVKHPAAYAERLRGDSSPAAAREVLDDQTRAMENIMLRVRLRDGLVIDSLTPDARRSIAGLIAEQLVDAHEAIAGRVRLTLKGRLLADAVVRRLLD